MEFFKKNIVKMVIAAVALTGAILLLIPTFVAANITFLGASQTIGMILFFVGLTAFMCLKIFDKTKPYAKFVLVGASVLVLIFMSIGLVGFNQDKDKAEGVFGNAYAMFKTATEPLNTPKAALTAISLSNAGAGAGLTMTQLKAGLAGAPAAGLATGLVDQGLVQESTTVAGALAIIEDAEKDANAGALTILFSYISMMLVFGLIPAVVGVKKIICKKDK